MEVLSCTALKRDASQSHVARFHLLELSVAGPGTSFRGSPEYTPLSLTCGKRVRVRVCVCDLTEVNPILGSTPSLGDPPFAPKVLIGSKGADEVSPQGAEFGPELQDGQGLLAKYTTGASVILAQSSPPAPPVVRG